MASWLGPHSIPDLVLVIRKILTSSHDPQSTNPGLAARSCTASHANCLERHMHGAQEQQEQLFFYFPIYPIFTQATTPSPSLHPPVKLFGLSRGCDGVRTEMDLFLQRVKYNEEIGSPMAQYKKCLCFPPLISFDFCNVQHASSYSFLAWAFIIAEYYWYGYS